MGSSRPTIASTGRAGEERRFSKFWKCWNLLFSGDVMYEVEIVLVWEYSVVTGVLWSPDQVVVSQYSDWLHYLSPLTPLTPVCRGTPHHTDLTMFLTEGLQDILPSNHQSPESQGMSSVVFKINVLIILMAVILIILFSLFVICFIM